jgi:hypothetical protein
MGFSERPPTPEIRRVKFLVPHPLTDSETTSIMSRKKLSTTVYITPEQDAQLKLLHERTKVPISVYIREGIDLALSKYAHLLPGQTSLLAPPPESERKP